MELIARAVHVMAVIAWMAGLFYLPRLFVYHADSEPGSAQSETFKIMERRLLKAIMIPAMVVTWIAGVSMLWLQDFSQFEGAWWMWIKLAAVVMMTLFHERLAFHQRLFAKGRSSYSGRYFRILNEVPTVLMVIIVVMAIVKPF